MKAADGARRATVADVPALVELRAEMFDSMGVDEGSRSWREAATAWFTQRLEHPAYRIVVVEVDGEIAACAVGSVRDCAPSPTSPTGGDVLINNVCTRPGARGRGYASAALDAVMAWAQDTGAGRAELVATDAGVGIYRRAGFIAGNSRLMRAPLSNAASVARSTGVGVPARPEACSTSAPAVPNSCP